MFIPRSVPKCEPNRSKWIDAIGNIQEFNNTIQTFHVCEVHFSPNDIEFKGKKKIIISGRVPTIFPNSDTQYLDENTDCDVFDCRSMENNSQSPPIEEITVEDYQTLGRIPSIPLNK